MTARHALVIDDSRSARFALRRYLEEQAYSVETAESPEEAYRLLTAQPTGVVFLDHVMPGVDGFDVLRAIRQRPDTATLPVVVCSSNEGPEFNRQARARGASAVLQKPPNPDELRRILDAIERGETPSDALAGTHDGAAPDLTLYSPMSPAPGAVDSAWFALTGRDGGSVPARVGEGAMREQLDQRLKKVSQGLLVQFAEIKATVAHVASQQARLAEQPNGLRNELRAGLDETQQALRLVTSRLEGVEREVFSQLTAMRTQLDATLKAQNERLNEMVQFARQTAAEEAQVVAERTVMTAALRISDQLADAILGAVGRK